MHGSVHDPVLTQNPLESWQVNWPERIFGVKIPQGHTLQEHLSSLEF